MRRKSTRAHTPLARPSRTRRTHAGTPFKFAVVAPALVVAALLLVAACAKKDPLAGLNELPAEQAKNLRPVADSKRLATQTLVKTPPTSTGPIPPCPQFGSTLIFADRVRLSEPVVECREPTLIAAGDAAPSATPGAANKLTDFRGFTGVVKDILQQTPLLCKSSKGPFPALLIIERRCAGTCAPYNVLHVLDVPNPIVFAWHGSLNNHPPGFEFVGERTLLDEDEYDCHVGTGNELP